MNKNEEKKRRTFGERKKYKEEEEQEKSQSEEEEERKRKDEEALKKMREKLQEKNIYTDSFYDDTHEYRIVKLGRESAELMSALNFERKILSETQWRQLQIPQSKGWIHYVLFYPEPYVMLFKREKLGNN